MIDFLLSNGFNFLVALTKSDKLNKTEREKQLALMENLFDDKKVKHVVCSSLNGEGVDELKNIIEREISK